MAKKNVLIIAGELSGDLHGSNLAKALLEKLNEIKIYGVGGKLMESAGVDIIFNMVDLAEVGFWEIVKNLLKFKHIYNHLSKQLDIIKPNAIILIDFPGFNLRFAREAKKRHIPIIYYISPQIWAWGERRIELIRKLVDKMIVVFNFEEKLYKEKGLDVTFVGHPLLDLVKPTQSRQDTFVEFGLNPSLPTIGILPGSRISEIRRHLSTMIKACKIIYNEIHGVQFVIPVAKGLPDEIFFRHTKSANFPIRIMEGKTYDCMNISTLLLVASGTATLEASLLEKPMIIIYKTSILTWLLLKPQIKIPNIGLVNVVAEERIVPELLQFEATPANISKLAMSMLKNSYKLNNTKNKLKNIKYILEPQGAASRAADVIIAELERK